MRARESKSCFSYCFISYISSANLEEEAVVVRFAALFPAFEGVCLPEIFSLPPYALQHFSAFPVGVFPFRAVGLAAITPFRGCFSVAFLSDM